jgi:hypothetical protein
MLLCFLSFQTVGPTFPPAHRSYSFSGVIPVVRHGFHDNPWLSVFFTNPVDLDESGDKEVPVRYFSPFIFFVLLKHLSLDNDPPQKDSTFSPTFQTYHRACCHLFGYARPMSGPLNANPFPLQSTHTHTHTYTHTHSHTQDPNPFVNVLYQSPSAQGASSFCSPLSNTFIVTNKITFINGQQFVLLTPFTFSTYHTLTRSRFSTMMKIHRI